MIDIWCYKKSNQVFDKIKSEDGLKTIITPGPQVSDSIRSQFQGDSEIRVITLSNFISENIEEEVKLRGLKQVGRSDFYLLLASIWGKIENQKGHHHFDKAYKLFTDLRSYTLDSEVLNEVLGYYPASYQKAFIYFSMAIDQIGIIDEHLSYNYLKEYFRNEGMAELRVKNSIFVFWGFKVLSGVQVDFLKSVGIYNKVIIPFSKNIMDKSNDFDWIKWVSENIIELFTNEKDDHKFIPNIRSFKRTNLNNEVLKIEKESLGNNYYFLKSELNYNIIQGICASKSFKVKDDFLIPIANYIHDLSINFLNNHNDKIDDFIIMIEEIGRDCLVKLNYKEFKVCQLVVEIAQEWRDLSDENLFLNRFGLETIFQVVTFSLPRIYKTNLVDINQGSINDYSGLSYFNSEVFNTLLVFLDDLPLVSDQEVFPDEVLKILSTVSPIPRGEFLGCFKTEILKTFLKGARNTVLIEEGAEKLDHVLSNILNDLLIKKDSYFQKLKHKKYIIPSSDVKTINKERFSATKLQSFIDCPRKFYWDYITKDDLFSISNQYVDARDKGSLAHSIIEKYWKVDTVFDKEKLIRIIDAEFFKYINENQKEVSSDDLNLIKDDLFRSTSSGIRQLVNIYKSIPSAKFEFESYFEHDSKNSKRVARVDLIITYQGQSICIDFKRGAGSVASGRSVQDYSKIQLAFYADLISYERELVGVGYICLNDEDKSYMILDDACLFINEINNNSLRNYSFNNGISNFLIEAKLKISETINLILEDEKYPIKPVKKESCRFCKMALWCKKEEEK